MWTTQQLQAIPQLLLEWYQVHARPMPWQANPDPYHLLVAATMLQQTQVQTVLPYLDRFLHRFPTVRDLASADEEEVLRYWSGLGYYNRARSLHRAAQQICRRHNGAVPCRADALRQLPGIGDYTAGAVVSIACGKPEPALDSNGYRILARLLAFEEDITLSSSRRLLGEACRQILPEHAPGEFNQALMDLGAMICTARKPRCLICPLAGECRAFQQGLQTRLPVLPARQTGERVVDVCAVIEHDRRWLMSKRTNGRLWHGLWEFPRVRMEEEETPEQAAQRIAETIGAQVDGCEVVATIRHGVMHYSVTLHAVRCRLREQTAGNNDTLRWVSPQEAQKLPLSSPMRRVLNRLIQKQARG
ncbi:MAG: A/G-specific adenine glycosylase [Armatimonadota bacterium]|nr:A/G-specific adenine glycosylase [bacterium]MDW8321017.1 A/G-specific adenine glycosylase [Armatimonadota bacterium]